ncbi:uncharacterized protein LOC133843401 [Drosophila sulfurigaster albostrigata]|uniref:uncharacterized protein LOC133843401 n=1 Tax=Drosophila sulfurigaster albostrigata TaxID=89887 RepID=UPI002D21D453|nr:uncharacterized protein LOC133843401 [Drosophila sulfurigaster albostrigata]
MDRFITKKAASGATEANAPQVTVDDEPNNNSPKADRKFPSEWLTKFSWLKNEGGRGFCKACEKFVFNHITHIDRHSKQALHQRNVKSKENQIKMHEFASRSKKVDDEVQYAIYTLMMFVIMHNLPISLMDYLPNLLCVCCPDSKIANDK